ncbi:acyl-CoA synthetase (AMP-forming)/AMP-acid ligase II [Tamaricihabitans halophyticus]|uniref:Acyl-CoA synthetase (AMP-forming)/AMP-acid ligase II n=1 Tax=Tamaricihabitans halophyticus TaxID=1262583 RepID=A0A4R2QBE1_9PSEU|nr:AMP-binding protein [Tamaricihabitans halophyticus]TCP46300.1 acyl-CoA synthetase (AMP-forming)/AMP-acid ligase II [Tamaricihabitans halophyticus]
MLAAELVRRGASRFANRTAVVVASKEFTFAEVDEYANRLANALLAMGAGRGSRVGLLMDNGEWSVPLDFACLKAGIDRVPLNSRLSVAEHARMIADANVEVLVHSSELTGRAVELAEQRAGLRLAGLGARERAGDRDLVADAFAGPATDPRVPVEPTDVVLTLYTSGTTGTLKAAQHTQASFAAITANILANLMSPGRDDAMLHAASLIHASGTFVLPFWIRGARSVVLPGFVPDQYLDALHRHRITTANMVPTMLGILLDTPDLDRTDLSALHTLTYGASPIPRAMLERGLDRLGPKFVQYYGQTEAPLCQTVLTTDDHIAAGELLSSCGHPAVDAEIVLTDDAGHEVPDGEIGEIRVRAPFRMAGYHNAPELNAETISEGGWLRTRDMARKDERGYLYLVDRRSDMIVTGGYNVYPREVEDALAAHPAVAEVAVVGAPDPTWVEAVTAFVTLRPGAGVSGEELRDAVRATLAGYKVPKQVVVVESIPKSAVGKILRRELRDPLWRNVSESSD